MANLRSIHLLVGPLHYAQELIAGHFLKALDSTHFGFEHHGLDAGDVGAAPSDQGVLNGNTHNHSGGDGGDILQTGPSDTPLLIGYFSATTGPTLTPPSNRLSLLRAATRMYLRIWYSSLAFLELAAPNTTGASGCAEISTGTGHLNLAPSGNVGVKQSAPSTPLDVTGIIRASDTFRAGSMTSIGFVRNSSYGTLSGGNAITTGDLPADIGIPLSDGFPLARWRGVNAADPTADLNDGDFYINPVTVKVQVYAAATGWCRWAYTA